MATRLIALVQAFDAVAADQEALDLASDKFQDLLKVHVSKCACTESRSVIRLAKTRVCLLQLLPNWHT